MFIRRLVIFSVIAAVSGTFGFLIGGGKIPEGLSATQRTLSEQARETAEKFRDQEAKLTEMLNHVRDRVSESVGQVDWFQDEQ